MVTSPLPSEALVRLLAAGPLVLDDREALQLAAGLSAGQTEAIFDEFGSLPEALGATAADLERRLPPPCAARVVLLRDVARRLMVQPLKARTVLGGWDAVADYLRIVLKGLPREQLRGLFLDGRNRLIRDEALGDGTVDAVAAYPREILRRALELNASAVVLAHNHPAGDATPSVADLEMTRQVVEAGRALRISVQDHFLIAGDAVISFRKLGLL
jgi:DNA repair protein RadC